MSHCVVPDCRHRSTAAGDEYICTAHWQTTDRDLRRLLLRLRRKLRNRPFAASSLLRGIEARTWLELKQQAIERSKRLNPMGMKSMSYVVVRNYTGEGAKQLKSLLEQRKGEIEELMKGIDGFTDYFLVGTEDGCFSVTVMDDKSGIDASIDAARAWIKENAEDLAVNEPKIIQGEAAVQF